MKNAIETNSIPEPNTGCWLWLRSVNQDGYGGIRYQGKWNRAHRVAYEAYQGKIPVGAHVLHLFVGTNHDNVLDRETKGRSFRRTYPHSEETRAKMRSSNRSHTSEVRRKISAAWKFKQIDNSTGFRGVFKNHSRFTARVSINGKRVSLGTFATAEEAGAVVKARLASL